MVPRHSCGQPIRPRPPASLRGDQPPVVGLAAVLELQLEPVRQLERELAERYRSSLSRDHGDDLRAVGDAPDRRRKRRPGAAPGDHRILGEAHRVAADEAPPGVVPGRRRHRARADLGQRCLEPFGVRRGVLAWRHLDECRQCCLLRAAGNHPSEFLRELGRLLGRQDHVRGVGQHQDLLGGHLVDPGEDLVRRRAESRAAVHHVRAEPLEERAHAVAGRDHHRPRLGGVKPRLPRCDLLAHVSHVEPLHVAGLLEHGDRHLRLVGVDMDLQRRLVADHEDGVADLLEPRDERPGVEARPGDDEVGAVPEPAVEVVRPRGARGLVVRELGERLGVVPEPGDDPGEDDDQAVRPCVDHAGLRQHIELPRGSLHRPLAGPRGHLEHVRQQLVLLLVPGGAGEALAVHVGKVRGDGVGHLADHGEHRPLGGIAHGLIGGIGGPGERRRDQDRVDELPRAAGELLGRPADDLAEDHAGVPPGAHQRRTRDGVHELVSVGRDRLAVEPVELLHHGLHGQRHVVARIAVGDREDVEVVDLLPAGCELRVGGLDDPAKALDGGIGRHRTGIIPPKRLRGLDDLVGLQAARAHVDAARAPAVVDLHLLQVGVETAPGGDHRVAPGVPERGPLAAAVTDLGHRDG